MTGSFLPNIFIQIVLSLLCFLVFGLQFIRYRKSHHLILAIAVPCTLFLYLWDNPGFFYSMGVAEAIALVLALIFANTIDRDKKTKQDEEENSGNREEDE
ncbi:MAG: hypothetical protein V3G42_09070 [Oscillospiraceae bacterium]